MYVCILLVLTDQNSEGPHQTDQSEGESQSQTYKEGLDVEPEADTPRITEVDQADQCSEATKDEVRYLIYNLYLVLLLASLVFMVADLEKNTKFYNLRLSAE